MHRATFILHGTMCQKVPESNPRLTVSEGTCPPLCLRGGLGRTRVTWWRGRPCVGSSDRPSQDAERDSGEEYDGTEGGGEELESSQRPGSMKGLQRMRKVRGRRHRQGVKTWESKGAIISVNFNTIGDRSDTQWLIYILYTSQMERRGNRADRKHTNGAGKTTGWGQSLIGNEGREEDERIYSGTHSAWWRRVVFVLFSSCAS